MTGEAASIHVFERAGGVWDQLWSQPLAAGGPSALVDVQPTAGGVPGYLFAPVSGNVTVFVESTDQTSFVSQGVLSEPENLPVVGTALAASSDRVLLAGQDGATRSVHVFERQP